MRTLRAFGGAVLLAGAAGAACTVMNGLIVTEQDVTVSDAGPEAAIDSAVPDPCVHASPPPPPPTAVDGPDVADIIVAIRRADFGETSDGGTGLGYDLDKKCTCFSAGPSCAPFYAPPSEQDACDGVGGVDLGGTLLIKSLADFGNVKLSKRFNDLIAKGIDNVLMRVTSFNGLADDSRVVIGFYHSAGILMTGDGGQQFHVPPKFDETDRWSIPRDQVIAFAGSPDKYSAVTHSLGYVTHGVLVMAEPNVALPLTTRLTNVVFTARLGNVAGKPTFVDGVVSGRWSTLEALRLGLETRDSNGNPLCASDAAALLAQLVCTAADIPSDPMYVDPARPCDAAAVTLAFTAAPASLGPIIDVVADPPACDAGSYVCPPPP